MSTHFLNGKFVTEEQLLISPRDLGFARGYAVFDFLKTHGGRPFKLKEHIQRLFGSADKIGLKLPWNPNEVEKWVLETLAVNTDSGEKFIKIIVSGGISNSMLPTAEPTIMILIDPAIVYPKEMYELGRGVITVKYARYNPEAKSNNYIEGVRQMQIAEQANAMEPVYYSDEQVYEGSNSNVFALINGKLLTPKTNVLAGVTRQILLENLKLDIPIEVKNFTIDQLRSAQEIFLSASGKEIVPITVIDGTPVGEGKVGPVTKEVMRQYQEYIKSHLG